MAILHLSQNLVTTVDDDSYDHLSQWKWCVNGQGYAMRRLTVGKREDGKVISKKVSLHRYITQAPEGMVVDHIDGNPLNNLRSNLRVCTRVQNQQNVKVRKTIGKTSKYKGVCFDGSRGHWMAYINTNNTRSNLGRFSTEDEAVLAYNAAAAKYHGDYARLNEV
jgi:hypothetical protein